MNWPSLAPRQINCPPNQLDRSAIGPTVRPDQDAKTTLNAALGLANSLRPDGAMIHHPPGSRLKLPYTIYRLD